MTRKPGVAIFPISVQTFYRTVIVTVTVQIYKFYLQPALLVWNGGPLSEASFITTPILFMRAPPS